MNISIMFPVAAISYGLIKLSVSDSFNTGVLYFTHRLCQLPKSWYLSFYFLCHLEVFYAAFQLGPTSLETHG
jgi:hypothetical protein